MRALSAVLICAVVFVWSLPSRATTVYQTANDYNTPANFVPFADDGTPGHPNPGSYIGDQVTLAGTDRNVTSVSVTFGTNTAPATDQYTCQLYENDGLGGGPGTLLGSSTVTVPSTAIQAGIWSTSFPFADVLVPNTFTYVLSSSHSPGTQVGPLNTNTATPLTGSAVDTVWYSTSSGWVSNNAWAETDGATTNLFIATITAETPVPEPMTMASVFMALGGLGFWVRRRARQEA
jgi:hypothetical protein